MLVMICVAYPLSREHCLGEVKLSDVDRSVFDRHGVQGVRLWTMISVWRWLVPLKDLCAVLSWRRGMRYSGWCILINLISVRGETE